MIYLMLMSLEYSIEYLKEFFFYFSWPHFFKSKSSWKIFGVHNDLDRRSDNIKGRKDSDLASHSRSSNKW